ncbi:iron ABC transporter permease [Cellulomonas sp. SLBN-39]|uniref:FecCD family ABC transporter permease n=1 Tax=Cellulomonas sp. SLBN-39 TaxID=2768446 RepID=UPI00114FF277|nr:iron ABC transporter permease [Cellulomonas sp. SLBN-39]TQL03441.1 iron complex transport system permease protein [Cellulomonas sp. SLBN-39]
MTLLHPTPTASSGGRSASLRRRRSVGLTVAVAGLALAVLASLAFGTRVVGWQDVVAGVLHPDMDVIAQAAVQSRVARTVLGLLVGAALGLAGAVMQGLTRNPLADPLLLGVSSGASLFVVMGIAWLGLSTLTQYVWLAFAGAAAASALVYGIGSLGREGATPLKLALAGAATSAALSSAVSMVLLSRTDVFDTFRFWQIGSIGRADLADIARVAPFLLVGAVLAVGCARGMDALALGDELATGLGQRTLVVRLVGALAVVLLCGTAVAIAGPIGFVGLVVPHLARAFTGPSHRWLLPYSAVLGAALLLVADVVGRVVARPQEIEVGIVTAVLGAPVFIAIIRRRQVREL